MTVEELRKYFVTARDFVKIGNNANTPVVLASVEAISNYVKELFETSSALEQAKCKLLYDSLDSVSSVIKTVGLTDRRVLTFFGLAPSSVNAPSFADIMSGKAQAAGAAPKGPRAASSGASSGASPAASSGATQGGAYGASAAAVPQAPIAGQDAPVEPVGAEDDGASDGADAPVFTPDTLRGFIGQQHIVKPLLKEIAIAKNEGRNHLDNILLFGNPGLGKTTLMELIAKELGVKFEKLDCSQFRNSQQSLKALQSFLMRVAQLNEPVVIALDEIHTLTPELQSSLLTLLNDREYVSPPDIAGNIKRIPIKDFTFIGATTDDDKVLDTIKNRCLRLTFQMVDYSPEELRRIYKNKIASKGLTVTEETIDACIPRSRGAIRYVNSIVEGLDKALYNDLGQRVSTHIDLRTALAYFKEKGIDPMGLTDKDLEILRTLNEHLGDAMGAEVLAARVGLDPKKYLSEYEKYLIKIGFISVSGKGRALTERAAKYLAEGGAPQAAAPVTAVPPVPPTPTTPVPPVEPPAPAPAGSAEPTTLSSPAPQVADEPKKKDIIDDLFGE